MQIQKFINKPTMIKRTFYALTLLLILCVSSIQAQNTKFSKEEFRNRQKEFFIQQAGLSNDEAQKFFPLYFELQDKKQAYNKEAWQKLRQGKNPNTTETEYGKIVEDVIQARIAADELELEYVRKYKQFLPAKKIYLLQKAEMRFHRELLKGFKHGQKGPEKKK